MTLPPTVRVGYQTVTVELVPPSDLGFTRLGNYSGSTAQIKICNDLNEVQTVQTFLHELFHAMIHTSGLSTRMSSEEEPTVDALSCALTQVLRDNPGLFEGLCAALEVTNPWLEKQWNVTAQGQYLAKNGPEAAEDAARAAGVAIGATAPAR